VPEKPEKELKPKSQNTPEAHKEESKPEVVERGSEFAK